MHPTPMQALQLECTEGQTFAISSSEGAGPQRDPTKWRALFESVLPARVA